MARFCPQLEQGPLDFHKNGREWKWHKGDFDLLFELFLTSERARMDAVEQRVFSQAEPR